jgi:hypothetical protein
MRVTNELFGDDPEPWVILLERNSDGLTMATSSYPTNKAARFAAGVVRACYRTTHTVRVVHRDRLPAYGPVRLVRTRRGCQPLEQQDRFDVVLNGLLFDQLCFNTTGYVGHLPAPPAGTRLVIGEKPIKAYREEVRRLNRKWAESPTPPENRPEPLPTAGARGNTL